MIVAIAIATCNKAAPFPKQALMSEMYGYTKLTLNVVATVQTTAASFNALIFSDLAEQNTNFNSSCGKMSKQSRDNEYLGVV